MSDLIYREDAIGACAYETFECYEARKAIRNLPSADRPRGEWIDAEIPLESGDTMPIQVCNLCKTFYPLAHTGGGYHFCPNCGCAMTKEQL